MESVIWTPELFLGTFGSTLLMKIRGGNEKMSSLNIQRIQQQWLHLECQRLSKDMHYTMLQVHFYSVSFIVDIL